MILRVALLALFCALPVAAQDLDSRASAEAAQEAAAQLRVAHEMLRNANTARNRVAALTETIQAYEQGLTALRSGIRQVTLRERALSADFLAQRQDLGKLLGVLASIERDPAPLLLLHPNGPVDTVRAGQLLSEIAPALQSKVEAVKFDLETLELLRSLQETAAAEAQESLTNIQIARAYLSTSIAGRADAPPDFTVDDIDLALLIATADTLDGFANGLLELPGPDAQSPRPERGSLALPVSGQLLRRFNERDAAGIERPGWVIATQPSALVTAPLPASIRYAGPLLDYGNVIILEPEQTVLVILTGLKDLYTSAGRIVSVGDPLGTMGGVPEQSTDFVSLATSGTGAELSQTLYVEVRMSGNPVDPASWFAGG